MKTMLTPLVLAIALLSNPAFAAGDAVKGKAKAEQVCAACHATKGDWGQPAAPENPVLAGQLPDYLVQALLAYKQGDKSIMGRKNAIMAGMVQGLSTQDMRDLAAFFAAQPGPLGIRR